MRAGGIDVASTGWAAFSLVVDGKSEKSWVFKPSNIKDSAATHLEQKYEWLRRVIWIAKPDVIVVEELAVFLNKKVIRALARHEGASLLAAKHSGAMVISLGVSSARSITFEGKRVGKKRGSLSKDDAWLLFKKIYPDVPLLSKTSGGLDQMDAYVLALAAPTILERR
jgi:Holliday junction resolvasome RuvABC endonuclease subunit